MDFWTLLVVVFSAIAGTESLVVCDGMVFHGVYHDHELLFEAMGKPYNLVMHTATGLLFFSHTIWNSSRVDFGVMACHVENRTCHGIPGVPGGYAVAHDRVNDDIFFGGHDGIYKYNFQTRTAKYFAEKDKSIWGLWVGKYFYYIEYPTQKLFVFDRDRFAEVKSAKDIEVDNFFMSRYASMYFSNVTGLYKVHEAFNAPIVLKHNIIVRQITEDMYGDIYICADDGIYFEERPYHRIKKVANIKNCYGLTFMNVFTAKTSRDLVIYSSADSIYRLLPSKYSKLCFEAIAKERKQKIKRSRVLRAH